MSTTVRHREHGLERPSPNAPSQGEAIVDVRSVPPAARHPTIFGAYEALGAGERFVLVNDHDPKPLYYQFQAEHAGEFTWEYLEAGPVVWRVRLGKPGPATR